MGTSEVYGYSDHILVFHRHSDGSVRLWYCSSGKCLHVIIAIQQSLIQSCMYAMHYVCSSIACFNLPPSLPPSLPHFLPLFIVIFQPFFTLNTGQYFKVKFSDSPQPSSSSAAQQAAPPQHQVH